LEVQIVPLGNEIPAIQEWPKVFIPDFPRDFFDQDMIG
jgi:hypothetical protein